MPYHSADREISKNVILKNKNEVKNCEYLGEFSSHGDSFKEAEQFIKKYMLENFANSYSSINKQKNVTWLETTYWVSAKAYFCDNK